MDSKVDDNVVHVQFGQKSLASDTPEHPITQHSPTVVASLDEELKLLMEEAIFNFRLMVDEDRSYKNIHHRLYFSQLESQGLEKRKYPDDTIDLGEIKYTRDAREHPLEQPGVRLLPGSKEYAAPEADARVLVANLFHIIHTLELAGSDNRDEIENTISLQGLQYFTRMQKLVGGLAHDFFPAPVVYRTRTILADELFKLEKSFSDVVPSIDFVYKHQKE